MTLIHVKGETQERGDGTYIMISQIIKRNISSLSFKVFTRQGRGEYLFVGFTLHFGEQERAPGPVNTPVVWNLTDGRLRSEDCNSVWRPRDLPDLHHTVSLYGRRTPGPRVGT